MISLANLSDEYQVAEETSQKTQFILNRMLIINTQYFSH